MRNRVPSFFLLVPGPWRDTPELVAALGERGVVVSPRDDRPIETAEIRAEIVEDAHLAAGFAWGRQGRLPDALVARVGACSRAALLEVGQRLDENPKKVATLGRALRDAGGVAVRMEASGLASPWEPWLERL